MAELELRLKYINDDFGKPLEDGSYSIRQDIKSYELLVDGVSVVDISVEYERFTSTRPNYSGACVYYDNKFFNEPDSPYINKGYTSLALRELTDYLLKENKVPKISLYITSDNAKSLRVAEKAGYKHIRSNEYSVYNPNAIKMYEEGLDYLKDEDQEVYEMQMASCITQFQKYIAESLPTKEDENDGNDFKRTK